MLARDPSPTSERSRYIRVNLCQIQDLQPSIRAEDWRSPLVHRLLGRAAYSDGETEIRDVHRESSGAQWRGRISIHWSDLCADFDQCVNTYQEPVLTEFAALAVACILVRCRAQLDITEVTRRGEKADYWLGDRSLLLEVSGQTDGDVETLLQDKLKQLRANPYRKNGYVCVASFSERQARLWFCSSEI